MASDNETVEEVIARLRNEDWRASNVKCSQLADEFESAWRRERELIGTSDWTKCAMCQTNKTGEGYGDIPPPVGYDDECDECEIAKRLRSGKPMPKRNCDRFASFKEALDAHKNECCESTEIYGHKMFSLKSGCLMFVDWLFATVAEGGES